MIVLCVVCWYVLKALRHPNLFSGVNSKTKLTIEILKENEKTQINKEEIKQLTSYIVTEKPYLNN
jgi:hypothetical protein